jgi:hypothetical protein
MKSFVSEHKFITGLVEVKKNSKTMEEFLAETGYKDAESVKRRCRKIRERFCRQVGNSRKLNFHAALNLKDAGIL